MPEIIAKGSVFIVYRLRYEMRPDFYYAFFEKCEAEEFLESTPDDEIWRMTEVKLARPIHSCNVPTATLIDLENPFEKDIREKTEIRKPPEVERFLEKFHEIKNSPIISATEATLEAWWECAGLFGYKICPRSDYIEQEILKSVKMGFAGLDIEYNKNYPKDRLLNEFRKLAEDKISIEEVAEFLSLKTGLVVAALKPNPWLRFFKPPYIRIYFTEKQYLKEEIWKILN